MKHTYTPRCMFMNAFDLVSDKVAVDVCCVSAVVVVENLCVEAIIVLLPVLRFIMSWISLNPFDLVSEEEPRQRVSEPQVQPGKHQVQAGMTAPLHHETNTHVFPMWTMRRFSIQWNHHYHLGMYRCMLALGCGACSKLFL